MDASTPEETKPDTFVEYTMGEQGSWQPPESRGMQTWSGMVLNASDTPGPDAGRLRSSLPRRGVVVRRTSDAEVHDLVERAMVLQEGPNPQSVNDVVSRVRTLTESHEG